MTENNPAPYKVFFHCGEELGLKTKVQKGKAWLDDDGLHVEGPAGPLPVIPNSALLSAELFRLHSLASVIRLDCRSGRLFLSVIRFLIGGQLMLVNYYKTVELHRRLAAIAPRS
ncbi:MAG: hypothetical protein WBQ64_04075 [Terriglobales bacterium]